MAKNHSMQQYHYNTPSTSNRRDDYLSLADKTLSSDNPAKWVGGILIGTIGLVGFGLGLMSKMNNGKR